MCDDYYTECDCDECTQITKRGPQGIEGFSGQGIQGFEGAQGPPNNAFTGPQGFMGADCLCDPSNFRGVQGSSGQQGWPQTGMQGMGGMQGEPSIGFQGQLGLYGLEGSQGLSAVGPQGFVGSLISGPQGIIGPQGASTSGPQGILGPQGGFNAPIYNLFDDAPGISTAVYFTGGIPVAFSYSAEIENLTGIAQACDVQFLYDSPQKQTTYPLNIAALERQQIAFDILTDGSSSTIGVIYTPFTPSQLALQHVVAVYVQVQ